MAVLRMMRRETLYQNLHKGRDFSVQHRLLTGEWVPLTEGRFHDLITMSFANCLEAFPRCPWNDRRNIRLGLCDGRRENVALAGDRRSARKRGAHGSPRSDWVRLEGGGADP